MLTEGVLENLTLCCILKPQSAQNEEHLHVWMTLESSPTARAALWDARYRRRTLTRRRS